MHDRHRRDAGADDSSLLLAALRFVSGEVIENLGEIGAKALQFTPVD